MIFLPRANFPTHFSVVSTNVRPPQVNQVLLDFVQFTGLIILLQLCVLLVANAFTCKLPTILYPGQGSVQSYHYTISCGAKMGLVVNHIRINQYIYSVQLYNYLGSLSCSMLLYYASTQCYCIDLLELYHFDVRKSLITISNASFRMSIAKRCRFYFIRYIC